MEVSEIDGYNGAITSYMDLKLNKKGFSGGILIVKNDQVLYEHYQGFADAAHKIPITDTTPFHVASTSKTFTSHAIFQLIEESKISLLDTINKFFPGFPYQGITIKNLLSHTTGLANYANFMSLNNWDKKQVATNNDMLQIIVRDKPKLEFPTGSHFSYCNTNFALLALIVEKVTGIPFPQYIKENIFDKVGMKHSYIMSINTMDRYTPSFNYRNVPYGFEFIDAIYGDKNVYTTCTDLKRYDSAIRNRVLLDAVSYDQMWQPLSPDRHSHNSFEYYGLGWRLKIWPNGNRIVYHNGWWHGNNSLFQRLIMDTAIMIITGNKFDRNIYSAAHAANIFRPYYDLKAGDEGEFDTTGQPNVTDQQEPKQKLPVRRARHARIVKSTKQKKAVKHSKALVDKKKKK